MIPGILNNDSCNDKQGFMEFLITILGIRIMIHGILHNDSWDSYSVASFCDDYDLRCQHKVAV